MIGRSAVAACGFSLLTVFAATGAEDTVFSLGFDASSVVPCKSAGSDMLDGRSRHPGTWVVKNYCKRIAVAVAEIDGEKCMELKLKGKTGETAFSFRSDLFPVKGGCGFRATFRMRGTYSLEKACGQWGRGGTYVGWYDEAGNRLPAEFHFGLACDDKGWQDVSVEGHVPNEAVEAFLEIGADSPNFKEGERLCLARAEFRLVDAASIPRKVVARPEPLTAELASGVAPVTQGLATLRDDGMTLIDGKPFFPIGIFSVHRCEANSNSLENAFRQLKDAGFNLVHTYDWKRGKDYTEYLDLAEKHGMKLLNNPTRSMFRDNVDRERMRPNMLAWYLADDASKRTTPEKLRRFSLDVKSRDNAHLTAQADSLGSRYKTRYADFIGSTDVFLAEIYTACADHQIGHEVLFVDYQVKALFRELSEAGNPVKGIWPLLQQFKGWGGWKRFPARSELKAMAYIAITAGAHGLAWYTYAAVKSGTENPGAADDPERWEDLASVTRQLSSIQDDLASRKALQQPKVTIVKGPEKDGFGYGAIHSLLKEGSGEGRLLVAVNAALQPVTAKFEIQGADCAEVLFESRRISAKDGIVDEFEPNGVHVYRLK